jgi:hypothetical protein
VPAGLPVRETLLTSCDRFYFFEGMDLSPYRDVEVSTDTYLLGVNVRLLGRGGVQGGRFQMEDRIRLHTEAVFGPVARRFPSVNLVFPVDDVDVH